MATTNDILSALDAFIRKYYKNLLIRGLLYSVGIIVALYLALVLAEHFGWLPSVARAVLFWAGVAAVAVTLALLVVRPWLRMRGHGRRRLSREEAARIVGRHFPEVGDKLLNLLQLMDSDATAAGDSDLLLAAIAQKTAQLRPVPMLSAINLRANRKYLRYALPPVAVLLVLLLASPRTVTEPTRRLVNYQTAYERPAPFRFVVLNGELSASQGSDFELRVATEGDAEPAEVSVEVDGRPFRMSRQRGASGVEFAYTFRNLSRSHELRLSGGGVSSPAFTLAMLPNPAVRSFTMALAYPPYTGRRNETLVDLGDAAVPEGTAIRWTFQTQDADSLLFGVDDADWHSEAVDANGRVSLQRRAMHTFVYAFSVGNNLGGKPGGRSASDTLRFLVTAVPDAAPMIDVEEMVDSLRPDRRLFRGSIKDDYGFSRLVFRHGVVNSADAADSSFGEAEIALGQGTAQDFYFSFNTAELQLRPGDALAYWFEVSDNDAIHGPKTTRSRRFEVSVPTEAELDRQLAQNSTDARQKAQASMSQLQQMQEEINEMVRRLVDKKELNWQDKKDLERLAERQREVRQMMQQMQRQIQENNRLEQKYREQGQDLMEKQRELDRLMNEVMDEQMKQTLAEIERMMQELDKQKVQQELEQLKLDNAELEKQIDQNLELMRRLELEKRVEQTVQKMDRLAEEQREVSRETADANKSDRDALDEKQQQLNQRFQDLKQDLKEIADEYKSLDPKSPFDVSEQLQQQIEQHQQEATQNLQRGKNKQASERQRQAADEMQELGRKIEEAQLDAEQEELAEDAEQVRQLLKSLVRLSMNQEELIALSNSVYIQDPRYQEIIASQNRVRDDFRNVDDSLRSMAKRQLNVAKAITKELGQVNTNVAASLSSLLGMNQTFYSGSRNTAAARSMQYAMTSLNNLALVLAESLDQMQNQMRQNSQKKRNGQNNMRMRTSQQCNNPGNKPSPKSMRQMQQELNKQMEALKKQLDKQGRPSQRHQLGQKNGMSEQFSKMAAQQEMIRRMMQEYGQEMKQQNAGNSKLAKEIDQMMRQMEETETDLVNRTITQQTIKRQQQIMTRLLEHEKADMEREREERRESHEGSDLYSQPSPDELERFNRQQHPSTDQLRTVPPTLSPYYRDKVNDYFFRP